MRFLKWVNVYCLKFCFAIRYFLLKKDAKVIRETIESDFFI